MELIDKNKLLEELKKLKQNLSASPIAIFWHFRKHSKKFEVIGNIHDNPKLLSKSKHA